MARRACKAIARTCYAFDVFAHHVALDTGVTRVPALVQRIVGGDEGATAVATDIGPGASRLLVVQAVDVAAGFAVSRESSSEISIA